MTGFDLRIDNAVIYDGSGSPPFSGSIAVKAGRIAALGVVEGAADQVVDAQGAAVSPGFVDLSPSGSHRPARSGPHIDWLPRRPGCVRPSDGGSGPVHTRFDMPGGAGRLYAEAIGILHVFVNGVAIARAKRLTGKEGGTLLCSGRDPYTVGLPMAITV